MYCYVVVLVSWLGQEQVGSGTTKTGTYLITGVYIEKFSSHVIQRVMQGTVAHIEGNNAVNNVV